MGGFVRYFFDGCGSCESMDLYREHGLPPVDLGDQFCDQRYKILHKLGQGGTSTVWLAHDSKSDKYVALKMVAAFTGRTQLNVHQHLFTNDSKDHPDSIAKLLDHFEFDSPNGHHFGLVYEMLGPNLGDIHRYFKFKPEVARNLARQLVEAVMQLHQKDIAFGDLSTSNILLRYDDLSYKPEQLLEMLGEPHPFDVEVLTGMEEYRKHAPKAQVSPISTGSINTDLLVPKITLIDLNEATLVNGGSSDLKMYTPSFGVHYDVAAPEYVFKRIKSHTKESDIWSLACCLFEIRASRKMIQGSIHSLDGAAWDVQMLLGPLPEDWISVIEAQRGESSGEQYKIMTAEERAATMTKPCNCRKDYTLNQKIDTIGQWLPWVTMTEAERLDWLAQPRTFKPAGSSRETLIKQTSTPPAKLSSEERRDFHDLLSRMLRLRPEERLDIQQVLDHPWLNKSYEDVDTYSEWIAPYARGYDTRDAIPDPTRDEKQKAFFANLEAQLRASLAEDDSDDEDEDTEGDSQGDDRFFVTRLLGLPVPSNATTKSEVEVQVSQESKLSESECFSSQGDMHDTATGKIPKSDLEETQDKITTADQGSLDSDTEPHNSDDHDTTQTPLSTEEEDESDTSLLSIDEETRSDRSEASTKSSMTSVGDANDADTSTKEKGTPSQQDIVIKNEDGGSRIIAGVLSVFKDWHTTSDWDEILEWDVIPVIVFACVTAVVNAWSKTPFWQNILFGAANGLITCSIVPRVLARLHRFVGGWGYPRR